MSSVSAVKKTEVNESQKRNETVRKTSRPAKHTTWWHKFTEIRDHDRKRNADENTVSGTVSGTVTGTVTGTTSTGLTLDRWDELLHESSQRRGQPSVQPEQQSTWQQATHISYMTNAFKCQTRTGAQRLKGTDIMKMPGNSSHNPWLEIGWNFQN